MPTNRHASPNPKHLEYLLIGIVLEQTVGKSSLTPAFSIYSRPFRYSIIGRAFSIFDG